MATNPAGYTPRPRLRPDGNPVQLLKSPLIYLRVVGIIFSIAVFGCVADQLVIVTFDGYRFCAAAYNLQLRVCDFAISVGVIACLICLVFLVKDFMMVIVDFSQAPRLKMILIGVDIAVNALWAFMWFVNFCYTADQRRRSDITIAVTAIRNCVNAGIALSFFSVILWGAIIGVNVFFLFRIISGKDGDSGGPPASGYPSHPEGQGGDDQGPGYTTPAYPGGDGQGPGYIPTAYPGGDGQGPGYIPAAYPGGDGQGPAYIPPAYPGEDGQGPAYIPPEYPGGDGQGPAYTPPEYPGGDGQGPAYTPPEY